MQSRSCASCNDVLDFGVGNTHASQPQIDPDLPMAAGKGFGSKKSAYQSPYSQKPRR